MLVVAGVLVTVGWRPRWTASIAAAAYFYVGWVSTLTGKVDHTHHVLWFLIIVAVSPSRRPLTLWLSAVNTGQDPHAGQ